MQQITQSTDNSSPQAAPAISDRCLTGDVSSWSVQDIVLWLHRGGRSGMLRIGEGLDAGVIFFAAGFLFRVEWGGLAGEEALAKMIAVDSGAYHLILRDIPRPEPNIHQNTESLLARFAPSASAAQIASVL